MPKLLENDQQMFNLLIRAQANLLNLANFATFQGDRIKADWYLNEAERCSRDMDEILSKYEGPEIITEIINGIRVNETRKYVDRMRSVLTERTVNVNVLCVVHSSRQGIRS